MLTQHEKISPHLVGATSVPTYLGTLDGGGRAPHNAVIDDRGQLLAGVSQKYQVADNREIVAAFDVALDRGGKVSIGHEVRACNYGNTSHGAAGTGKFMLHLALPSLQFPERQGGSLITPGIVVVNSHGANGSLKFMGGTVRMACENQQILMDIETMQTARHSGSFDFLGMAQHVVDGVEAWSFRERTAIVQMRATQYPLEVATIPTRDDVKLMEADDRRLIHRVVARIPDNHQKRFRDALRRSTFEQGHNLYALEVAATETATHAWVNPSATEFVRKLGTELRELAAVHAG